LKKKITIDARMLYSSGIGTYIFNVLSGLIETMPEISFEVLLSSADINSLRGAKLLGYSNVKAIEIIANIYTISEQFELYYKVRNTNLFWSPHYNVPLFLSKNIKRLVTIHDVYHLAFKNELSLAKRIYAKVLMQKAVRSDMIITVSKFSKEEIIKYTNSESGKIEVIYNGIEKDLGKETKTVSDTNKFSNSIVKERYLIYVGNVKPHKNLKILVDAFTFLKHEKDYQALKLVIVGKKEGFITNDKELFEKLDNMPQILDDILFTGWIEDSMLKELYNHAEILVFPSIYEGFGLPPLEAMSMSCPVISSDAACMKEINGEAVLYFNPKSVEQLKVAIASILNNNGLKNKLIEKGKKRTEFFTWENSVMAHKKLISSLI